MHSLKEIWIIKVFMTSLLRIIKKAIHTCFSVIIIFGIRIGMKVVLHTPWMELLSLGVLKWSSGCIKIPAKAVPIMENLKY